MTGSQLQSVLFRLIDLESCADVSLDAIRLMTYTVTQLTFYVLVPTLQFHHIKIFLKFWWDQEMEKLQLQSTASCKTWKAAGRPRSGPVYDRYRKDKLAYRNGISHPPA